MIFQTIDIFGYLNILCAVSGAIIFVLCIAIVNQIIKLFPKAKMTSRWKSIKTLILFFLAGYIMNILAVFMAWTEVLLFMQAFVYIFGAIFVYLVVSLSKQTYMIILNSANN